MWKFNRFGSKEHVGMEGRSVEVGSHKVHVRNTIAEGGFSSVYLARDILNGSKQYALKHMICNDEESLQLVLKEISVMNSLKGHPNIVTFYDNTILDMGRTKEALLLMEYCDKSLVSVLDDRGAGYFDEKQVLSIFRDVCNAVFAMHSQSPPVAHRDLKIENILLGADGSCKLCDFGSCSTNHKRFEKPGEMGIEEDNIRKHTTPAYRAPEMWDLLRRDIVSEKVDIWALGCILFRVCYFKPAFDGESKLQILNGNYRIPELPRYSSSLTDLVRDMLKSSPDARPDITQVWFRVNQLLPSEFQKSLPDGLPRSPQPVYEILGKPEETSNKGSGGAFWNSQHALDSVVVEGTSASETDGTRLSTELARLKEELHQANLEKEEMTSKFKKLSAICQYQRHEIKELKQALSDRTSPGSVSSTQSAGAFAAKNKNVDGTVWELEKGMMGHGSDAKPWAAFPEDGKRNITSVESSVGSVGAIGERPMNAAPASNSWGFETEEFTATPASRTPFSAPDGRGEGRKSCNQPAGWAGF